MVVMIDSICQLLQVNRITERSCVFTAYTLALYFKYHYYVKFELKAIREAAVL